MSYSYQSRPNIFHITFFAIIATTLISLISARQFLMSKEKNRTIALNNAKTLAGGLLAFKTDKGAYPCEYTREMLKSDGIENLPAGKSANAYLAQLCATEVIDFETFFHTPGVEGFHKGDNKIDTNKTLLAPGENGFAYIMTLQGEALSDVRSITPIVMASVKVPGIVPTFDTKIYKGVAVYGAIDGSGKFAQLNEHGNALFENRIHLFQTGKDSLFGEEFPVVTFPKPAKKK